MRTPWATSKSQASQRYQKPFSKTKAGKVAQQPRALAAKLDDPSLIQNHTWWKERIDFRSVPLNSVAEEYKEDRHKCRHNTHTISRKRKEPVVEIMRKLEPLFITGRNVKWCGKQLETSQKIKNKELLQAVVAHAFNLSTWESEPSGSL